MIINQGLNKAVDSTPTENSTNLVTSGGVYTALSNKMDNKTIDTIVTENSTNLVTSGAVYTAVNSGGGGTVRTALTTKQQVIDFINNCNIGDTILGEYLQVYWEGQIPNYDSYYMFDFIMTKITSDRLSLSISYGGHGTYSSSTKYYHPKFVKINSSSQIYVYFYNSGSPSSDSDTIGFSLSYISRLTNVTGINYT